MSGQRREVKKGGTGKGTPKPGRVKDEPVEKSQRMDSEPKLRVPITKKPGPERDMWNVTPRGPDESPKPDEEQVVVEPEGGRRDEDATVQVDVPNIRRPRRERQE